jgi:hypothetical protein
MVEKFYITVENRWLELTITASLSPNVNLSNTLFVFRRRSDWIWKTESSTTFDLKKSYILAEALKIAHNYIELLDTGLEVGENPLVTVHSVYIGDI